MYFTLFPAKRKAYCCADNHLSKGVDCVLKFFRMYFFSIYSCYIGCAAILWNYYAGTCRKSLK